MIHRQHTKSQSTRCTWLCHQSQIPLSANIMLARDDVLALIAHVRISHFLLQVTMSTSLHGQHFPHSPAPNSCFILIHQIDPLHWLIFPVFCILYRTITIINQPSLNTIYHLCQAWQSFHYHSLSLLLTNKDCLYYVRKKKI